MFKQYLDTSFNDYRQTRVVIQELSRHKLNKPSLDFQKFCSIVLSHQNYKHEPFKIEYCYVKEEFVLNETSLYEIQFYRRPSAFLYFAACQTSEELEYLIEEYVKLKRKNISAFNHFIVYYKTTQNDNNEEFNYSRLSRPSISSMISVDSYFNMVPSSTTNQLSDSISIDTSEKDEYETNQDEDATASIEIMVVEKKESSKLSKPSLFKTKSSSSTNIIDSFDSDVTRTLKYLETNLAKCSLESKQFNIHSSCIDSQLADIRLMVDSEKDCTLLECQQIDSNELIENPRYKSLINQFDMSIIEIILNQYLKANVFVNGEFAKQKLPKKTIEARIIKRRGDCFLLLGAIEKANQEFRRAVDALKTQNDHLWYAAALEARVATYYLSIHKPKRSLRKTLSLIRQSSFMKKLPVDKYLTRANSTFDFESKLETALDVYKNVIRSSSNDVKCQLELDACIRWCSFLVEQNDVNKYRSQIISYIDRINTLGTYVDLDQYMDIVYINLYLAQIYEYLGFKRKSALYYRSAAVSGLTLLNEQDYHEDIDVFVDAMKQARIGYGINDNRFIFPLVQKTLINESIQISLKKNDFTTIIENVHFAIELLIDYMTDDELEALLTFLDGSDQFVSRSYCRIPRIKSLELIQLSNKLEAIEDKGKNSIFLYFRQRTSPGQHKSLQREVDFVWIKNENSQIKLVVENCLPSKMTINQLQFITNKSLEITVDKKYSVPARTTKTLIIDCIPKETGHLQIQGLRYHSWSTNHKFMFDDFPAIRHCSCSVKVVDELPLIELEYVSVNDNQIRPTENSSTYNAQVYQGGNLSVTLGLVNISTKCNIEKVDIEVSILGIDMTDCAKIIMGDLPILTSKSTTSTIDLSEIYERYRLRQDRSTSTIECLVVELCLKYTNDLSEGNSYYRKKTIEIQFNYLSLVTIEINDIKNIDDDLSYALCCTIENNLTETIQFEDTAVEPSQSTSLSIKQNKILLNSFPSNLNQLIDNVRNQLPIHLHYQTMITNKQCRLFVDWKNFSNEYIKNYLYDFIKTPFTCHWNFKKYANALHIDLCVESKHYKLSKLEFLFPPIEHIRFLNSNRITFYDIEPGKYFIAKHILVFEQDKFSSNIHVHVNVNDILWKQIDLVF